MPPVLFAEIIRFGWGVVYQYYSMSITYASTRYIKCLTVLFINVAVPAEYVPTKISVNADIKGSTSIIRMYKFWLYYFAVAPVRNISVNADTLNVPQYYLLKYKIWLSY
jgi:hypothetical protein